MSGAGFDVAEQASLEDRRVQVQVSGLAGSLGVVEVSPTDTLSVLKAKIAEQCGIPVFEQQLVCGTKIVEEHYGTLDREQLRNLFPTTEGFFNLTVLRIQTPVSAEDLLRRKTAQLLTTAQVDGLATLLERFHAEVVLESGEHLEIVLGMIVVRAFIDPVSVPAYVDILSKLSNRYPLFPPEHPGDKPSVFKHVLRRILEIEFEEQLLDLRGTSSILPQTPTNQQLQHLLSFMKFVGLLFVAELVRIKVVGFMCDLLVGPSPHVHGIQCVCELLQTCGEAMEATPQGPELLGWLISRMIELQGCPGNSQEIPSMIQDLVDLLANQWVRTRAPEPLTPPVG